MEENEHKLESVNGSNSSPLLPIESLIHVIRAQQVMLDSDLARLYGVETRVLNQAVKRNIERFPEDFMFQLSKEESQNLISQIVTSSPRSQNVTLNVKRGKNIKYLPYKYLKRAVKANIKRFPPDFMFELELTEFDSLRCKNCTSNTKPHRGGTRYMPFAFTQKSISMFTQK